ncbi:hypothetical protein OROHE_027186 [Orobanche hederae]
MGSGNGFYSDAEFSLDPKWLVDPRLLFVGPKIGEGAHAKVYEGKYKNQNVAIKIVHRGETPEEIAKRESRFGREVSMLSRVQHKNLVKVVHSLGTSTLLLQIALVESRRTHTHEDQHTPVCVCVDRPVGGSRLEYNFPHSWRTSTPPLQSACRVSAPTARSTHTCDVLIVLFGGLDPRPVRREFIGACKEPVMVIVTELLLGGTLRKYLLNLRPRCLDMCVAIGFALDIARAMECLHSHGIIHRDLKPENLLLTADHKTVKLADFGLAREESLTEMMTAETGTYRWMAPELYSTVTLRHGEKKHYNHKVDAYSFAIVLWELIHNKLPFEGMSNLQAAYAAAFKNTRPSADDLPQDLALIVTSCWKEDPNARPNFTQIIQMLLHYLATISPTEPVIPHRIFGTQNAVFSPDSPGTSSLMAKRDDINSDTPKTPLENKRTGFFFCFYQCW